jgi:hypothetical protein
LSDHLGYLLSSFIAFLAFVASAVALGFDFALFTVAKNELYKNSSSLGGNVSASYGTAIWLTLAATVLLFLSTFAVCFGCCAHRRSSRY